MLKHFIYDGSIQPHWHYFYYLYAKPTDERVSGKHNLHPAGNEDKLLEHN